MNTKELRELSVTELKKEMLDIYKEKFNLQMQKSSGQLTKPNLIRNARRNIARIKTIIVEKTGAES